MNTLAAWLAVAVGPLAKQVLVALGVGVVTYAGLSVAVGALLGAARDAYLGTPADVLAYLRYAGVPDGLAIICGGITARVSLVSLKRLAML